MFDARGLRVGGPYTITVGNRAYTGIYVDLGKTVDFDADLSAGAITDEQARHRRKEVGDEADFYGAMDGASKFVKGDAIAGLVITMVNLIGGFLIGVVQMGMDCTIVLLALTVVAGWMAGRDDAWGRFAILLPVMLVFGFFSNLTYALIGSLLRQWLGGPYVDGVGTAVRLRWFNRGMAAMLAATALWMARF